MVISPEAVQVAAIVAMGLAAYAFSRKPSFVGSHSSPHVKFALERGGCTESTDGDKSHYTGPVKPVVMMQPAPIVVVSPYGATAPVQNNYYQQAPAAPHNAPAHDPHAALPAGNAAAASTVPTPHVEQTGPAGSPVTITGGANDLMVRWRITNPAARRAGWSAWSTILTLPGGVKTLTVGTDVRRSDLVVAQFCRGVGSEGPESAPWTVA